MEVADRPAAESPDHGEPHRQPTGCRDKHQELHRPQLGQVAQALFRDQVLLVGVGEKRDSGMQGQIPAQPPETLGVEPARLLQQQHQRRQREQGIADQQRYQIASGRFGAAAGITDPTQQRGLNRVQPAVPGRLGAVIKHLEQVPTQQGSRKHDRRQGDGSQQPREHACQGWVRPLQLLATGSAGTTDKRHSQVETNKTPPYPMY